MSSITWVLLVIVIIVHLNILYSRKSDKTLHEINEKIWAEEILAHQNEWGQDICHWLIENRIDPFVPDTIDIVNKFKEMQQYKSQNLFRRSVGIDTAIEVASLEYEELEEIDKK